MLALAVLCSTLSVHVRLPGTGGIEQIFLWIGVAMFAAIFLLLASCIALAAPAEGIYCGETSKSTQ